LNPYELLPGNEERESTLRMLKGQLATLKGKKKEADTKVNNLADSIATTENPAVRRTLEDRLAQALDEQSAYEAEAKQLKKDIEQQTHALDDTRAKLESLRQLLAFLKERTGDELIDVRRRLREELRGLIARIDVFPVGRTPVTEERLPEIISAVLDVLPEQAGTEEMRQFEDDLQGQIENKDLRRYHIQFKGGSFCTIIPASPHKLSLDFDRENDTLRYVYQTYDGKYVFRESKS
jgi:DNA repair exonuclease SbcCD ATPase subunit